jgi:hypothetical protein
MVAVPRFHHFGRRLGVAMVMIFSLAGLEVPLASSPASANVDLYLCSSDQLAVAIASPSGAYFAAGNVGIPFIIVNISTQACVIGGYPRLEAYPASYKHHKVTFTRGGGMIFLPVRPRNVVLEPGSTASFGVDYGDAYNQGDPNAGACLLKEIKVFLPTQPHPYSQPFSTNVNVNFCYANFHYTVTSIQGGPIAKKA